MKIPSMVSKVRILLAAIANHAIDSASRKLRRGKIACRQPGAVLTTAASAYIRVSFPARADYGQSCHRGAIIARTGGKSADRASQ